MEPMLAASAALAEGLEYREPKLPIVSNLSGELLSAEQASDPAYWVAHVREPVRFADAVQTLAKLGAGAFVELGPDPVLSAMAADCLQGREEDEALALIATLREGRPEPEALSLSLAAAHAAGAPVDWQAAFKGAGAKTVPLPTYPFQRKRYWLPASGGGGDLAGAGLDDPEHPLLGAVIEDPQGEGLVMSGRVSLQTHPWLADHAVAESVILPGTAFLELAMRAGRQCGCELLEELTLQAPLILPEQGAVQIQVAVSEPDQQGARELSIHSRPESGAEEQAPQWTAHAAGSLAPDQGEAQEPLGAWPPAGAEPLALTDLYERLAEIGLEYGPAFQGLSAAWQDGEDLYAEVSLPAEHHDQARRFLIHPALLDAALHPIALAAISAEANAELRLPFAWSEVALAGGAITELRVKVCGAAADQASLMLADGAGAPLARIGSLRTRPLDPSQLNAARRRPEGLFEIEWKEVSSAAGSPPAELKALDPGERAEPTAPARAAMEVVQAWLSSERHPEQRLAILTRGAVGVGEEESPDPALAGAWALLCSAQSEHPERFVLIDSDASEASQAALEVALTSPEPQIALREGRALAPRVVALKDRGDSLLPPAGPWRLDPQKTVLVTGGTGGLGSLIARRLVEAHGARHILLSSRSGAKAKGAKELKAQLQELGAKVKIAACDVADREQLQKLLTAIPDKHPLGAVIHTAGVLDDTTIESMRAEQIGRVFAPKAEAALHLHELCAGAELSAFVMFSSAAGALGGPGQGNYAAANAFLDALAKRRRGEGLAGTSIAWGLWQRESAMTSDLDEANLARIKRSGLEALGDEQGLDLFDQALSSGRADVLALNMNPAALRKQSQAGMLPAILSALVRAPRRSATGSSLAAKLAALPEAEREPYVLELVRSEVAAVLGHDSAGQIDSTKAFKELGFDSLAAVELRNRLRAASGVRLAATAVFDYPTPAELAGQILRGTGLGSAGESEPQEGPLAAEFDRLESMLSRIESEGQRESTAARLRALLARVDTEQGEDLAAATDEEMFELLDQKLGRV